MQVSFTSVRKAAELVAAIIKHGFKPAALEMMDTVTIQAVDKAFKLGLFEGLAEAELNAILLIELDGDADEVLLEASKIRKLIQNDFEPLRYRETQDPSERALLWKVRKGAAAAFGNIAPYWYLYDLVVPRSKIPDAMDEIREIADKHDLLLANVFHAADGNLHPNFLYDLDKDPGVVKRIFAASHELMEMCVRLGGTLSGEHGIGVEKQEYMKYIFSEADMKLMLRLRQVFDPKMISNPEKLFPVRICREAACDQALNRDLLLA